MRLHHIKLSLLPNLMKAISLLSTCLMLRVRTQWITLLQAFTARSNSVPHVRIIGIDDPVSKYAGGDGLAAIGRHLPAISQKFNIPIEFHDVSVFVSEIAREMLQIRPGEELVVNFPLLLHHTPDESVDMNNPRDGLLRMVRSLSFKVVTLVEQESNPNTALFLPRFKQALEGKEGAHQCGAAVPVQEHRQYRSQ